MTTVVGEEVSMNNELTKLLLEYLADEKSLDDVAHWVGLNVWDAPAENENVIDQLAIELSHLDDGMADEEYFRSAVHEILGIYPVVVDQWEGATIVTTTATGTIYTTDSAILEGPIEVGPVVVG